MSKAMKISKRTNASLREELLWFLDFKCKRVEQSEVKQVPREDTEVWFEW